MGWTPTSGEGTSSICFCTLKSFFCTLKGYEQFLLSENIKFSRKSYFFIKYLYIARTCPMCKSWFTEGPGKRPGILGFCEQNLGEDKISGFSNFVDFEIFWKHIFSNQVFFIGKNNIFSWSYIEQAMFDMVSVLFALCFALASRRHGWPWSPMHRFPNLPKVSVN